MSMASGFTATCLLEIPEGAPAVDLYYPMGEKNARKLIRVHAAGTELPQARRAQMLGRGVRILWIRSSDESAFLESLARSRSSLSQIAHCLLDACFSAGDMAMSEATVKAALQVICRWINRQSTSMATPVEATPVGLSAIWSELSQIALAYDLTTHSGRVATIAVLFAMAFENTDPLFLSDLAVAGFLHDIGKLKLGIPLASSSSQYVSKADKDLWESHPQASIELIEKFCPEVSERTRLWIMQHHERFGGGGYPLKLEGYKVDDISQLLAAADLIDELASGRWDEKCRGLRGAFEALENFDREQTFPQYFNPDLFKTLLGWANRTKSPAKSAAA
ncbi:MAG: HD-GYP domain-containing protein [Bdellovibrionia bacterium]